MSPIKHTFRLSLILWCALAFFISPMAGAQCPVLPAQMMETAKRWDDQPVVGRTYKVQSWYVQDGDSLSLAGGHRLRLGQINTTEMATKKQPIQAFAQQGKDQLKQLLSKHQAIYVQLLPEEKDHYGRWLVSLYDGAGNSAEGALVDQGLAYVISMNEQGAKQCLWQQEAMAQKLGLGLWQAPSSIAAVRNVATLSAATGGFMRVGGLVADVSESQQDWYISLAGLEDLGGFKSQVALKVSKKLLAASTLNIITEAQLEKWIGQKVTARGWLTWRRLSKKQRKKGFKSGVMTLYHLDMLERIPGTNAS